jgi:hypothetical protein
MEKPQLVPDCFGDAINFIRHGGHYNDIDIFHLPSYIGSFVTKLQGVTRLWPGVMPAHFLQRCIPDFDIAMDIYFSECGDECFIVRADCCGGFHICAYIEDQELASWLDSELDYLFVDPCSVLYPHVTEH